MLRTVCLHYGAFCQIGKARQQAIPTATTGRPIDAGHLSPGDCVSCDQLQSTCPGRIPVSRGTPSTSFYHAATLFVDHASRYVHVTPNRSTGADEALESKRAFERDALSYGVQVRSYRSDNGIFASNAFKASCAALNQLIDYCAVGAHHQNGIVERIVAVCNCASRQLGKCNSRSDRTVCRGNFYGAEESVPTGRFSHVRLSRLRIGGTTTASGCQST